MVDEDNDKIGAGMFSDLDNGCSDSQPGIEQSTSLRSLKMISSNLALIRMSAKFLKCTVLSQLSQKLSQLLTPAHL